MSITHNLKFLLIKIVESLSIASSQTIANTSSSIDLRSKSSRNNGITLATAATRADCQRRKYLVIADN